MKYNILIGVLCFAAGLAVQAVAQAVTTPPIVALACAYNAATPTGTSGQFMLVQCDINGRVRTVTGSF